MYAGSFSHALKGCNLRLAVLAAIFLLVFATQAFSQEATIVGTVTDPTGLAVLNAKITITNTDTGLSRTLMSNADGQYVAPDLRLGRYMVRVEAAGFKVAERKDIVLHDGDRLRADFSLQVGNAKETITVEANAVAVQTDTGEVSNVLTTQQVSDLPTNGRTLYNLYALAPGASSIQGDNISPTAVSGDNSVSINGQRIGHNLLLLDGGENLDRGGSQASVAPSIESIAEYHMNTSNYSAEYGMSGATTINEATKSGGKQFHGSAWEFDRNDDFDARNYFNPAPAKVAELRYNLFGFNVGGPVDFLAKEKKTFFFYNMEWRRLIQGQLLNQTVPLASWYPTAAGAVMPTTLPNGKAVSIVDPASVLPAVQFANCPGGVAPTEFGQTVTPGSAFPENTIPTCMIDANAAALLTAGGKYGGIFPQPTNAVGQFIGGNNVPTYVREEIARVDHTFSSKVSVFGHWVSEQIAQNYGTTMWSGDNVPSVGNTFGNPAYSAIVHLTYAIRPTLLNEVAFNYDGNRIHILPVGLYSAPSNFTEGANRLFTGPNVDNRIPAISLGGSTGSDYTPNWTPWNNAANDYQIRDDVSWSKGAHQLKFGFGWMIYKKVQDYFAVTQGQFTFNGVFTTPATCVKSNTQACGLDFADFLLGDAQTYNEQAVKATGHWNNVNYNLYAQDNWRVNHRLTLNLGLRWDGMPHTYEANHQSANFYPNLYNPANAATFWNDGSGNICAAAASATANFGCTGPSPGLGTSPNPILKGLQFYENGIGIGGVNGIPKGLVNGGWNLWAPRLGFAYDLTGRGKTVVRAGFGMMYDRVQGNDMYDGATNTPFDASPTLHNVALSNPGLNINTGATISAAALPILPVGITGIQPINYKLPTTYQYSAGIQQQLGAKTVLGISYVGAQTRHASDAEEFNLPPLADVPLLLGASPPNINPLYNYAGFGGIQLYTNEQNGHYNSLQFDLHGNVTHDLQLQVAYTYARAIDPNAGGTGYGGDMNNVTDPYVGWRYDVGPSSYVRNNVAFVNFVYQIPFLKGADNRLLRTTVGGWQISGIVTFESGAPINLGVSGSNVASVIPNSGNRPDVTGSISYPKTVNEWFNTSVFSAPTCLSGPDCYGNLGMDALRGPGRDDWNLSLFKSFVISESRGSRFELRADAFNTWNHTQFKGDVNTGGISTSVGSSNFGAITGAFDPREFQIGAKLVF
jgi:hypothetical protein